MNDLADQQVDACALAMINDIRARHVMRPLSSLGSVSDLDRRDFRAQAQAAIRALQPAPALPVAWQSMDSAPRDRTPVLLRCGTVVGEAYFDPDAHSGTWWWAGTSKDEYFDSPIEEINDPPSGWMPLPPPDGASTPRSVIDERFLALDSGEPFIFDPATGHCFSADTDGKEHGTLWTPSEPYGDVTPPAVEAQGVVAYADKAGNLFAAEGSPLPAMLKAMPDAPVGEPLLPLYARLPAAPPVDAGEVEKRGDAATSFIINNGLFGSFQLWKERQTLLRALAPAPAKGENSHG